MDIGSHRTDKTMDKIAVQRRTDLGLLRSIAKPAAEDRPIAVRPFPKGRPPGRSHNRYPALVTSEAHVNRTIVSSTTTINRVISVTFYERKDSSIDIALLGATSIIRWNVSFGSVAAV